MTVPEQLRAIADRIERGEGETAEIVSALRNVARELEQRPRSGLYTIALRKEGATWHYWVKNPVGGGSGGPHYANAPKSSALRAALHLVPPGSRYLVITNGEPGLEQTKPGNNAS